MVIKIKDELDLSTEWNQAKAYQYRLHEISERLGDAKRNVDFNTWSNELWNFYSELSSQMIDEEANSIKQSLLTADNLLRLSQNKNRRFMAYLNCEVAMRRVMRDRGMLLPEKDDPAKAIR